MSLKLHLFNRILTEIFSEIHLLASQTVVRGKHFKVKKKKKKQSAG